MHDDTRDGWSAKHSVSEYSSVASSLPSEQLEKSRRPRRLLEVDDATLCQREICPVSPGLTHYHGSDGKLGSDETLRRFLQPDCPVESQLLQIEHGRRLHHSCRTESIHGSAASRSSAALPSDQSEECIRECGQAGYLSCSMDAAHRSEDSDIADASSGHRPELQEDKKRDDRSSVQQKSRRCLL